MQNPNDIQHGGNHYRVLAIQHWDIMYMLQADYFTGAATKYLARFEAKNGLEDLKKARHFVTKLRHMGGLPVPQIVLRRVLMQWHGKALRQFFDELKRNSVLPQTMEYLRREAIITTLTGDTTNALRNIQILHEMYNGWADPAEPTHRYTNQD